MHAAHRRPRGALAALSLLREPLADVGRAAPEFDAVGFGLCQKPHSLTVDQLYLCEFDGGDTAFGERDAKDLQVFRGDSTADVKEQTVVSRQSVDSARHGSRRLSSSDFTGKPDAIRKSLTRREFPPLAGRRIREIR